MKWEKLYSLSGRLIIYMVITLGHFSPIKIKFISLHNTPILLATLQWQILSCILRQIINSICRFCSGSSPLEPTLNVQTLKTEQLTVFITHSECRKTILCVLTSLRVVVRDENFKDSVALWRLHFMSQYTIPWLKIRIISENSLKSVKRKSHNSILSAGNSLA